MDDADNTGLTALIEQNNQNTNTEIKIRPIQQTSDHETSRLLKSCPSVNLHYIVLGFLGAEEMRALWCECVPVCVFVRMEVEGSWKNTKLKTSRFLNIMFLLLGSFLYGSITTELFGDSKSHS